MLYVDKFVGPDQDEQLLSNDALGSSVVVVYCCHGTSSCEPVLITTVSNKNQTT